VLDGVFQVFVAERHIEARASCVDPHVRRDHRLAATDRGPHRLAQHRVDASAAMLHLAVDADDCALAIGDGWSVEHLDELRHETFAEFLTRFEERPEIVDKAAGEGVEDHRHADHAHNRPQGRNPPSSERIIARIVIIVRISTIRPS
jgi:hypothetical protein